MPHERGIYELPANRAGEHALYAVDSNGLIVGWDGYTSLMDMTPAVARLRALLEREDPLRRTQTA